VDVLHVKIKYVVRISFIRDIDWLEKRIAYRKLRLMETSIGEYKYYHQPFGSLAARGRHQLLGVRRCVHLLKIFSENAIS
jgi:hypothetical protein